MPNRNQKPYFQEKMNEELVRLKKLNPRFSMRAFASKLGCDPSSLSKVLAGKTGLSLRLANGIVTKMKLDPDEGRRFLKSVLDYQKAIMSAKLPEAVNSKVLTISPSAEALKKLSSLDTISVLECYGLENPEKVLRQLRLDEKKVLEITELLVEVGVVRHENGKHKKVTAQFRTDPKDAADANLIYQRQILEQAETALENTAPELRIANGLTMVIAPERLPQARKMVVAFFNELCEFLEQGEQTQVYQLGFQLFPLYGPSPRSEE